MDGMTWDNFLHDINVIFEISQQINDNWIINKKNDDIGGIYLSKRTTRELCLNDNNIVDDIQFEEDDDIMADPSVSAGEKLNELIIFEYHVLYHLSFAVPYLCFNAFKSNGSFVTLDEAWTIFNDPIYGKFGRIHMEMTKILTQMEHPVLFKPFLTLHPCKIAELLGQLPNSKNKTLSFLSTIGPAICLSFDLRYCTLLKELE